MPAEDLHSKWHENDDNIRMAFEKQRSAIGQFIEANADRFRKVRTRVNFDPGIDSHREFLRMPGQFQKYYHDPDNNHFYLDSNERLATDQISPIVFLLPFDACTVLYRDHLFVRCLIDHCVSDGLAKV